MVRASHHPDRNRPRTGTGGAHLADRSPPVPFPMTMTSTIPHADAADAAGDLDDLLQSSVQLIADATCALAGFAVVSLNVRVGELMRTVAISGNEDARAALEFLRARYPGLPFSLAGFSFGSRVILSLGCEPVGASRLIAAGFPASYRDSAALGHCGVPRIFVQSTNDQYGPRPAMQSYFDGLSGDKRLIWVDAEDHFFAGALDELEATVTGLGSVAG